MPVFKLLPLPHIMYQESMMRNDVMRQKSENLQNQTSRHHDKRQIWCLYSFLVQVSSCTSIDIIDHYKLLQFVLLFYLGRLGKLQGKVMIHSKNWNCGWFWWWIVSLFWLYYQNKVTQSTIKMIPHSSFWKCVISFI